MPFPTSSSTVKVIRGSPRDVVADETGGRGDDHGHTCLVVRPEQGRAVARHDVVTELVGQRRHLRGSRTWPGVPRNWIGLPDQSRCTIGTTLVPEAAGDVSTWAINPTVGASATEPGTVAKT